MAGVVLRLCPLFPHPWAPSSLGPFTGCPHSSISQLIFYYQYYPCSDSGIPVFWKDLPNQAVESGCTHAQFCPAFCHAGPGGLPVAQTLLHFWQSPCFLSTFRHGLQPQTMRSKGACQVAVLSGRLCTQTPWPVPGKGQACSRAKATRY